MRHCTTHDFSPASIGATAQRRDETSEQVTAGQLGSLVQRFFAFLDGGGEEEAALKRRTGIGQNSLGISMGGLEWDLALAPCFRCGGVMIEVVKGGNRVGQG